ncbi:MAG: succinate dehydrogenase cytochrome b subunit [Actinomycetales bacterium]|jgi:succinate dehydrogenase / fumarate reductase cytochrome b subunit|nr:succinate dehydrogenase cytochrome b subunit [Candidatus Lutibacillus vidarii]HON75139.1 succinate dehydrogenase cytochrome b subunit [Dermatophilaceae bacterium]HRC18792.1 succinate dehydrogenase cytochrome b subunit [Phycicoccus elongatus]
MKILMAASGLLFVLYVLMHMYGNLKIFAGQEAFDGYAHHLRTLGEPILPYSGFLWLFRALLIVALVTHAGSAYWLWSKANGARSTKYQVKKAVEASLSSKMMRWGGTFLLLFLVFHLLQYTTNSIQVNGAFESPYQRVLAGFSVWWVVVIYLLALFALGMHLHHGVWSASQTLGLTGTPKARRHAKLTGLAVALIVGVGFALPPLAILFGLVKK